MQRRSNLYREQGKPAAIFHNDYPGHFRIVFMILAFDQIIVWLIAIAYLIALSD